MPESPYAGLNPFSVKDAPFFFGRNSERDLIVANLMAARLTVLYGPSGVGKSSVLNAGALNALAENYTRPAADGRPLVLATAFQRWQTNPAAELAAWLASATGIPAEGSLIDKLAAWSTRRGGRLLLIFDQFEEYLLYHEQANDEFGQVLPQIFSQPGLAVNVLISIREDSIARLDAFKGRVPNLLQNNLRLDRLTHEAGRAAIVGPLERFNALGLSGGRRVTIEPALVEAVLSDVRAGHLRIGDVGRGHVTDRTSTAEPRIETAYLQLVMKRLWDTERRSQSDVLRLETYRRLGGAQRIVEAHLDETVQALSWRERAVAAVIFEHLVTPTRSKIAHTSVDLATYARVEEGQITTLLGKLSGPDRILATVAPTIDQSPETRYQIFHDVLASAVLAWSAKQRAKREQRRRFVQVAAVLAVLAVLGVLGVLISRTRQQAHLIGLLQKNAQDIAALTDVQTGLRDLTARNQTIESQLAKLEATAQANAPQLTASLSEARKTAAAVALSGQTLADQATRVGASLANNQRQIAQAQGVSNPAPAPPENLPVSSRNPAAGGTVSNPLGAPPPIPAPSPETQPAPKSSAPSEAEAGVLAALDQYAAAYRSLDTNQVLRIFPGFNEVKRLADFFANARSYDYVVTPSGPIAWSNDLRSAKVECRLSGTFQMKGSGRQNIKPETKTFYLERRESGWVIVKTIP